MEAESRELRRANEILKAASAFPGWSRVTSGVSLRFLRGQSTSVGSRANLHCLVPVRHTPVTQVRGVTNVMSNAKPQPGSTGATRAAHTSPWAQSHPNKQTTNTQQYERKRPQHSYYKSRDLTGQSSGDITRGTTPVMWRYTLYVTLHPIRTGAMPTDRVHRARRQERSWNLESRNTTDNGLNTPPNTKPGT